MCTQNLFPDKINTKRTEGEREMAKSTYVWDKQLHVATQKWLPSGL